MTDGFHDWLVLHRVLFSRMIDGTGTPMPGPASAVAWRFYPDGERDDNGMRTYISDEWGGFSLYCDRADAQAVFDAPEDHLPFLGEAIEAWHALVIPYAHRGEVNWRGTVMDGTSVAVAGADPGGPLVILTSAGYDDPGPEDLPRIRDFWRGVQDVVDFYAELPGNVRRGVFSGGKVDDHDGATMSLWKDDPSMLAAAYHAGSHRAQLDLHKKTGLFDRSSFTRTRIVASRGTWGGVDPVSLMT